MPNYVAIASLPFYCEGTTKEEIQDRWRDILKEQFEKALQDGDLVELVEDGGEIR